MTSNEIRDQVLYNLFGEATPPVTAPARAVAFLKDVIREIEDSGKWWWSRKTIFGFISPYTKIFPETPQDITAGELPELSTLLQNQSLLGIERVFAYDSNQIMMGGATIGNIAAGAKGRELVPLTGDPDLMAAVAAQIFQTSSSPISPQGVQATYVTTGVPQYYYLGNDITTAWDLKLRNKVIAYPAPAEDVMMMYLAEISARTPLFAEEDDDLPLFSQTLPDKLTPALIAGGTRKLADSFNFPDISQRAAQEYLFQIERLKAENARLLHSSMDCEYNDL